MKAASLNERSDEELAVQAQAGCAASFDALVRRFQTPLLQFLRRRGNPADAEDLLQEAMVRAYVNLHQYRPRWRFATWMFTIARRVSINYYRRARPVADDERVHCAACDRAGPAETVAADESRQRLWDVAQRVLSEEEQTALWLHYVEELTLRDVGLVLGRSWGSVKTMVFRARKKMLPWLDGLRPDGVRQANSCSEACAAGVEVRDG